MLLNEVKDRTASTLLDVIKNNIKLETTIIDMVIKQKNLKRLVLIT